MTLENDDLEELANEIRRLIESNREFLERAGDEDYEDEEGDSAPEQGAEEFEEL